MRLPFVTADLPGSGGAVKATPEDFQVEEIPAYLPAGAGPHLWLKVEKRDRTTREVIQALATALNAPEREAGFAGLKDKRAVAVQWISFPVAHDPDPAALGGDGFRVLAASRHRNKLRTGHLRGNRFRAVVRGGDAERARAVAEALAARGFANFYGSQRFGAEGDNARVGKAVLLGRLVSPEARRAARDRFLRRLCISAYQSLLFNRWLAERLADGLFARALAGDVMRVLPAGGLFTCQDPEADQPRLERFQISPAGPMVGHKLPPAAGEAAAREARLLQAEGLALPDLARRGGGEAEGARRAARLPVKIDLEPFPQGYVALFQLPRGSYASVVLAELVKGEAPELSEPAE